jgi:hypothetical protein
MLPDSQSGLSPMKFLDLDCKPPNSKHLNKFSNNLASFEVHIVPTPSFIYNNV